MNKHVFIVAVKKLLELNTEETIKLWVAWAEECVARNQYEGYRECDQVSAVQIWLDFYFSSFSGIKQDYGNEIAIKILNMSQINAYLYPYEMRKVADVLKICETKESRYVKTGLQNLDWQDNPEIPLSYKTRNSLVVRLANACADLLQYRYGISAILKSDYDLIEKHASFLVYSHQVCDPEDINLGAIYECFNDTKIAAHMMESDNWEELGNRNQKAEKSVSIKNGKKR